MKIIDLLNKKRKKIELTKEEIDFFVEGVANISFKDYEISAMLMAIAINGMTDAETYNLTMAMAHSGDMLNLSDVCGIKVDKHSSGGVSDTTTLALAPILAVVGLKVAKMSGRGLGYTGGTIDKLESINGFNTALSENEFKNVVNAVGAAIICQTAELAPADKVLYALRDQTATVESLPLIASSIMSKKLASGADVILLDVKCGKGAFMKNQKDAEELAKIMVEIGKRANKTICAVVTDMNYPLGAGIGCSLEVSDAISVLKGAQNNLATLSKFFATKILSMSQKISETESAVRVEKAIESGDALRKFAEMIKAQGGDESVVEKGYVPHANCVVTVPCDKCGFVENIDPIKISEFVASLGGARTEIGGKINHRVGVKLLCSIGDKVCCEDNFALVYSETALSEEQLQKLKESFKISNKKPAKIKLIKKIIK